MAARVRHLGASGRARLEVDGRGRDAPRPSCRAPPTSPAASELAAAGVRSSAVGPAARGDRSSASCILARRPLPLARAASARGLRRRSRPTSASRSASARAARCRSGSRPRRASSRRPSAPSAIQASGTRSTRLLERADLPLRTVEFVYLMLGCGPPRRLVFAGWPGAAFLIAARRWSAARSLPIVFVWLQGEAAARARSRTSCPTC